MTTLLYITLKDYPEFGRLKVVKDNFKFSAEGCDLCYLCGEDEACKFKMVDSTYNTRMPNWLSCGRDSYHFEKGHFENSA